MDRCGVPASQEVGHSVHSLKGVTIQSLLQGSRQGLTDSGRGASGHLKHHTDTDRSAGHSTHTQMCFDHRKQVDKESPVSTQSPKRDPLSDLTTAGHLSTHQFKHFHFTQGQKSSSNGCFIELFSSSE